MLGTGAIIGNGLFDENNDVAMNYLTGAFFNLLGSKLAPSVT